MSDKRIVSVLLDPTWARKQRDNTPPLLHIWKHRGVVRCLGALSTSSGAKYGNSLIGSDSVWIPGADGETIAAICGPGGIPDGYRPSGPTQVLAYNMEPRMGYYGELEIPTTVHPDGSWTLPSPLPTTPGARTMLYLYDAKWTVALESDDDDLDWLPLALTAEASAAGARPEGATHEYVAHLRGAMAASGETNPSGPVLVAVPPPEVQPEDTVSAVLQNANGPWGFIIQTGLLYVTPRPRQALYFFGENERSEIPVEPLIGGAEDAALTAAVANLRHAVGRHPGPALAAAPAAFEDPGARIATPPADGLERQGDRVVCTFHLNVTTAELGTEIGVFTHAAKDASGRIGLYFFCIVHGGEVYTHRLYRYDTDPQVDPGWGGAEPDEGTAGWTLVREDPDPRRYDEHDEARAASGGVVDPNFYELELEVGPYYTRAETDRTAGGKYIWYHVGVWGGVNRSYYADFRELVSVQPGIEGEDDPPVLALTGNYGFGVIAPTDAAEVGLTEFSVYDKMGSREVILPGGGAVDLAPFVYPLNMPDPTVEYDGATTGILRVGPPTRVALLDSGAS